MNVKKSVLENKTDQELEQYLKEGNRFVPQANQYALEILKLRGRNFSDVELEKINTMITEKRKSEEIVVSKSQKKSANLMYLSAGLGVINILLLPNTLNTTADIITVIFTFAVLIGTAALIGKGVDWIKYVLLVLVLFGLLAYSYTIQLFYINPIVGLINIVQAVLQIYALVLLFRIPNPTVE
ncbi:hypothetical protein [Sphingobacterium corticibacter]|uniref:Uncharacterized protein n=1 Tax=Sphingobacterium corticibacter TaxID=2171749 RepID=A0A2T8HJ63_9SPHI|nr:hypothetical protein [Sphingobacterium corticibacter]PVH25497.1 hypothetical protein DC487_05985 [Sphingobacterium corticibacter]